MSGFADPVTYKHFAALYLNHFVKFLSLFTCKRLLHLYTGISIIGGPESTGSSDVSASNIIEDYSTIRPMGTGLLFRCVSGLGPTSNDNIELGGLLFGSTMIEDGGCNGPVIQPQGTTITNFIGVINVFLCSSLNANNEGVYTCMMRNSSMMEESVRVGVYLSSRSEL